MSVAQTRPGPGKSRLGMYREYYARAETVREIFGRILITCKQMFIAHTRPSPGQSRLGMRHEYYARTETDRVILGRIRFT